LVDVFVSYKQEEGTDFVLPRAMIGLDLDIRFTRSKEILGLTTLGDCNVDMSPCAPSRFELMRSPLHAGDDSENSHFV
jgi:hypothetical protein